MRYLVLLLFLLGCSPEDQGCNCNREVYEHTAVESYDGDGNIFIHHKWFILSTEAVQCQDPVLKFQVLDPELDPDIVYLIRCTTDHGVPIRQ